MGSLGNLITNLADEAGEVEGSFGDPLQGTRSPARPTKRSSESNVWFSFGSFSFRENVVTATVRSRSDDLSCRCSSGAFDLNDCVFGNSGNWSVLSTDGDEPTPRFNHAAAVIGSKMVVVGGESGHRLLDDTMILSLDKLTWVAASPKVYLSPSGLSHKIPACKGHCLVPWGKMVILIGGKTEPASDRVAVWSFDIETECWSHLEAKGDIPVARSGHTVIRAGPVLILFGRNRSFAKIESCCRLRDDKILFIFGGQSKSKILNDLYSLDFETMVWSRVKTRGSHPSARAGCCGALCGTKWYIIGGGSKKRRHAETLVFDVLKLEWSESVTPPSTSIITNKGFSMVPVQHKDKILLVAFGGKVKEASNKVEVLVLVQIDHSMSWRSAPDAPDTDSLLYEDNHGSSKELASVDSLARSSLASAVDQQASGRKSLSDSSVDPHPISDSVSLRKQFHQEEDCSLARKLQKPVEIEKHRDGDDCSAREQKSKKRLETAVQMDIAGILAAKEETLVYSECTIGKQKLKHITLTPDADHDVPPEADGRAALLTSPSNIYQLYETNIASLTRKNSLLEEQLTAALSSQETAEKSLSSAVRSREDAERRLADALKEAEVLKEKLAGLELAQEEANSLSNAVHADNVRLEHDVAFLKAILDDTQKASLLSQELHSTRGVLAGERARAFQLQVEVFHLKQRLQSAENRAPTPRKPYH
uniref:Acyl-CoA-binding domain-containing protein 4 n=1 Tax=Ananas comosus var. bracteatus TaxID=296719 RepID=A0A6V7QRR7_ANACO